MLVLFYLLQSLIIRLSSTVHSPFLETFTTFAEACKPLQTAGQCISPLRCTLPSPLLSPPLPSPPPVPPLLPDSDERDRSASEADQNKRPVTMDVLLLARMDGVCPSNRLVLWVLFIRAAKRFAVQCAAVPCVKDMPKTSKFSTKLMHNMHCCDCLMSPE